MTTATITTPHQSLPETTPRRAAVIAGIGYLTLFVLALFANFFVIEALVVPGDAAQTAANIAGDERLVRFGTLAFLGIFAIDVVVAWALYVVFAPVGRGLALLMAWFRLVYTMMLGVALVFLMGASRMVGNDGVGDVFEPAQVDTQVAFLLDAFDIAWMIGLAVFGLHLVMIGYLIVRSRIAPVWLGWIVAVAGIAYVVDTSALVLLSDYDAAADVLLVMVAVPAVIAELGLTVWLLAKAGRPAPSVAEAA